MGAIGHSVLWLAVPELALCLAAGCSSPRDDACHTVTTTPVGWTEQTPAGSPEALFSSFSGTCQAPFRWDASGWAGIATVEPPQGQSTLTATVALDSSSARWVAGTGMCQSLLQVDGTVTLALPEGEVAHQQPVTIGADPGEVTTSLSFALQEKDFGSWVSVQKSNPQSSLSMLVGVTALARGCSGEVTLNTQSGTGEGFGAAGRFATWSDTGCGVGQSAVRLDQPWQGIDLAATVAASFGQVTLPGTWKGAGATTLSLRTSLPAEVACADAARNGVSVVTIPADIVANSADGLVYGLSGRGNIRVSTSQAGAVQLELGLSTDLSCANETDPLPYGRADCATVSKVTAQLSLARSYTEPSFARGRLDFYVYQRPSSVGAANRTDELVLGP
jgi:hypothetical protein